MSADICTGILDCAHWDADDHPDLGASLAQAVAADGIVLVIAKITQGRDYVDPTWKRWVDACRQCNVKLGAYHFMSNTEAGELETEWFLAQIAASGLDPKTMPLASDFERNPKPGETASVPQAEAFVQRVHDKVGFWPLLYGDPSFHHQITNPKSVLVNCPLWPAEYGSSLAHGGPPVPPAFKAAGKTWTIWQYTDGIYSATDLPKLVTGFPRMDRSVYRGSSAELLAALPALGG